MKKTWKYILSWVALIIVSFIALTLCYQNGIINAFYDNIIIMIGINIILATGLNLVIGVSGQFSLGHAGFMAIGAYATAIMSIQDPTLFGFIKGLLVGMILSAACALLVGIPTLRLKGDYLAIATLGVAEIIRNIIVNMNDVTNGAAGLYGIPLFVTWEVVFVVVVITTVLLLNFGRSSAGRATISIREDEIAAESMGINTTKYKVMAFVLGAITASIAGGLHASYVQMIQPKDFTFNKSVDILIIVVFGGLGSFTGCFIAAIVLGIVNMFLQDMGTLRMIIYALILIIIMIFRPGGLLGTKEFTFTGIYRKLFKKGRDADVSSNN